MFVYHSRKQDAGFSWTPTARHLRYDTIDEFNVDSKDEHSA